MEGIKEIFQKFSPLLEDIQRRLYITSIIFIVSFAVGFFSTSRLLKVILSFFVIDDVVIATTSPFQFADLSIDIGLFCAFLICIPVFAYHTYLFLKPALSRKERMKFFALVPMSAVLFVFGFSYGFLILYYALLVLAKINVVVGVQNIWDIGMFLSQIILTSAFLGALFQFPIIVTYLIRAGLIPVSLLRHKRRVALFIIFVFTTLLPPTDGLSLLAMALPLILLYEITILVNSRVGKVSILPEI